MNKFIILLACAIGCPHELLRGQVAAGLGGIISVVTDASIQA